VTDITLDTIDSEFIVTYGRETPGDMKLRFQVKDPFIETTEDIQVIDTPRIKVIRSAIPKVA
jgi:hypothetical protein